MKQFIRFFALVFIAFLFLTATAFAEKVTFVKEYNYNASDLDSKVTSRAIALEQVKRLLLEELGTYLISETEVKNFRLTKEQVTTYSAGIVSAEVVDEKWDGKTYYLKAKVSADPEEVIKSLQNIVNDKQKSKELEDVRKKAAEFSKEIERLKKELEIAKADTKKPAHKADEKKIEQYNEAVKGLSATDWYEKGVKFYKSGNHKEALNAYNKAIELNPEYSFAYYWRGLIYFELGNYQKAIEDAKRAAKFDHSNNSLVFADIYCLQAAIYMKLGDYQEVLNALGEGVNIGHDMMWLSLSKGKIEIDDINKIIKKFPNDFRGYIVRGIYYSSILKDKSFELSIVDYKKALNLNPQYALGYYLLGKAYSNKAMLTIENTKNYQNALNAFTRAIELNLKPTVDTNVFYERGFIYLLLEKYKEAIAEFNKALEINPESSSYFFSFRGDAHFELGNYQEAINDYTKAIELKPKYAHAYYNRGLAYNDLGNKQKFIADMKIAAKLGNKEAQDYLRSKGIEVEQYPSQGKQQEETVKKGLSCRDDIDACEKIGRDYYKTGEYDKAVEIFSEMIGLRPFTTSYFVHRGNCYLKKGENEKAISDFKYAAGKGDKGAREFLKSKGIKW